MILTWEGTREKIHADGERHTYVVQGSGVGLNNYSVGQYLGGIMTRGTSRLLADAKTEAQRWETASNERPTT